MTRTDDVARLVEAAATRFPQTHASTAPASDTELHLYHAANSICSQKVRATLDQCGLAWASHLVDIFKGENYDPAYVRLRIAGCADAGLGLTSQHLGSTSVAAGGCDACVVPTLVDARGGRILVDSRRICEEIDRRYASTRGALVPAELRGCIDDEIDVIDHLPNYQILAIGVGHAPAGALPNGFAKGKVARCDSLIAEHAGDEALCAAYAAKRAKEQMAADRLFDAEAISRAYGAMARAIDDVETRLSKGSGPYILGDRVTLADLFWGVELIRMEDLGMASLWQGGRRLAVADYFAALSALPSIRRSVVEWPGARLPRRAAVDLEAMAG